MQSVCNVIMNRSYQRKISPYAVVTERMQFSSLTAPGDPQLGLWAAEDDPQWIEAQDLAAQAVAGALPDITGGATCYFAESMNPYPAWAERMEYTGSIAGQRFYR